MKVPRVNTVTGRISCASPNETVGPKRGKIKLEEIQELFSDIGYVPIAVARVMVEPFDGSIEQMWQKIGEMHDAEKANPTGDALEQAASGRIATALIQVIKYLESHMSQAEAETALALIWAYADLQHESGILYSRGLVKRLMDDPRTHTSYKYPMGVIADRLLDLYQRDKATHEESAGRPF